ncbi:MAG: hypothetical protein WAM89_14940 [Terriglobales bacterium]
MRIRQCRPRHYCGVALTLGLFSFLPAQTPPQASPPPSRLAIYYGYPSLVNGSNGDVEKAALIFAAYDVVVLGDGLEFADRHNGRVPEGDPEEHEKTRQIIASVHRHNPATRFFGYVCLGDIVLPQREAVVLSPEELKERIGLWKRMGVAGIFLDEAGYDYPEVTRKRQNLAIALIHEQGLSAFMNAYFLDHLFGVDDSPANANGSGKNSDHQPSLLDKRDLLLLESFTVNNGAYESPVAWQPRIDQAMAYRRRYGVQIFSTTTSAEGTPFSARQFTYAWWTARLYGVDGFSWGEPNFAASNNTLPDRRCQAADTTRSTLPSSPPDWVDRKWFWKNSSNSAVIVDTSDHSVRIVHGSIAAGQTDVATFLRSTRTAGSLVPCSAAPMDHEH